MQYFGFKGVSFSLSLFFFFFKVSMLSPYRDQQKEDHYGRQGVKYSTIFCMYVTSFDITLTPGNE